MVALVAACLGVCNVVLNGKNLDVLLVCHHVRNPVNIRSKRTDNADTGNVIHISNHIFNGGFVAVPLKLFHNAFRAFDTRLDMLNGIVTVYSLKLVI